MCQRCDLEAETFGHLESLAGLAGDEDMERLAGVLAGLFQAETAEEARLALRARVESMDDAEAVATWETLAPLVGALLTVERTLQTKSAVRQRVMQQVVEGAIEDAMRLRQDGEH